MRREKAKIIGKPLADLRKIEYTCHNAERTWHMTYEELREEVRSANLVLAGLGEELADVRPPFMKRWRNFWKKRIILL